MNCFRLKKVIQKKMSLALLMAVICFMPKASAVLLGPDDTDEASLERAKAFPAVCFVDGHENYGSGVLIHKDASSAWILTAAHIIEGDDTSNIFITFSGYKRQTCLDVHYPSFGHMVFPSWTIKKDLALVRIASTDWLPEPLALFDPHKNFLDYDTKWKIWRGIGHIVGYGRHGTDPNNLLEDHKRRHVQTPFIVDVARDEKDEGCGFWNIITCAPSFHESGATSSDGTSASSEESTFPTLLARCRYTQRMGIPPVDDEGDITQYIDTIPEKRIPFHGTTHMGDSGGPLLVTKNGTHYVLGICYERLTDPKPCLQSYFMSVPYFTPWIHTHIPALATHTPTPHGAYCSMSHPLEKTPSYVDDRFMYLLHKKSYTGRPTHPPLGIHVLSMSTNHTL